MKSIEIWTDGACSGNPGPGGWAALLRFGKAEKLISGGEESTTNNRMELTAVIRALEALKEPCSVTLRSDSKYVVDAMTLGWAEAWHRRGWVRRGGDPAKNPELWERLLDLARRHEITWEWVRGHAVSEENRRCDAAAVAESRKYK
ncbi:MAG: ribonuclease HI [Oscillospiraceae bacterium]|nr:ribonuclease HI [Oscillospiraceae bacterium]